MAKPARFAGSNEPLQIFQDDLLDDSAIMTSHAPMPSVSKPSRRPLGTSSANVVLNPPSTSITHYSPLKNHASSSPRSPSKSPRSRKLHMVHMAPPAFARSTTDSLQKKPFLSKFKTHKPLHEAKLKPSGKENAHPPIFPAPTTIDLALETYQKPNGKRGLLDAAPIQDDRPAKKTKLDDSGLPPHDCFPPICDDGTKPPHSYAQLIGMAILRSPMRRLTLAQIYKWISDNYSFYNPNDAGWQNSIRHNLSLHKNFIKIERPKDDPGKGNYWGIEPGTEFQFLKEKQTRKAAPTAENLPVMSTRLEPSRPLPGMPQPMQVMTQSLPQFMAPAQHLFQEPTLPPAMHASHAIMTGHFAVSEPALPAELSSDATIPASDGAAQEGGEQMEDNSFPFEAVIGSSLPAELHSSPPVHSQPEGRSGTPPPAPQIPASSGPRSHKRKFASMDDSGYISSLESSVMRPNATNLLFTSEADRPRVKRQRGRGRAEEEIARIRHSSPYSPSKGRSQPLGGPLSSSPLRPSHESRALQPLTPAAKLMRAPALPTASPNTHLRIHRANVSRMLQSPLRQVTGSSEDAVPWSPAFNLEDSLYNPADGFGNGSDADLFKNVIQLDDVYLTGYDLLDAVSPLRRSAKRTRLDRSVSAAGFEEVMRSGSKRPVTSAPLLKAPTQSFPTFLDTPSKAFEGLSSPSRVFQQSPLRISATTDDSHLLDFSVADFPALILDGSGIATSGGMGIGGFSEVDILQGFEKIGAEPHTSQQSGHTHQARPPLGRSYSTSF